MFELLHVNKSSSERAASSKQRTRQQSGRCSDAGKAADERRARLKYLAGVVAAHARVTSAPPGRIACSHPRDAD